MAVQLFLPDRSRIVLRDLSPKDFRGLLLPGSRIQKTSTQSAAITIQEVENPFFIISHRVFELFARINLTLNERSGIRLEALLSGEINISRSNERIKLKAGQYHLTDVPLFNALFKKTASCSIFVTYYSEALLNQLGITLDPSSPLKLSKDMTRLIQDIFRNPYDEKLRNLYYETSIRDLLFFHLAQGKTPVPGQLKQKDITATYKADAIISSNLNEHLTIGQLSRMAETNQFKLKKGFKQVFGMGVFRRLLFLRMEQAKTLLETTNLSIGEIAELAGYDTAAGFIHAFRREFKMTPREWRLKGKDDSQ